jgi:hypothetical protein
MKNFLLIILSTLVLILSGCKAAGKGGDKSYFSKDHTPFQNMPTGFHAKADNITTTTMTFSWGQSAGADTYSIMYKINGSANFITFADNAQSPYQVSGLQINTAYDFVVVAKNSMGQIESNIVSFSTAANFNSPLSSNISVNSFDEDIESVIYLPYVAPNSGLATSCEVNNLNHVTVTTPCQCNLSGQCYVGVTGVYQYYGFGSFDYRVLVGTDASTFSTVSFNINPVNDPPTISNIAAITTNEDVLTNFNFTIADPDTTLQCSGIFLSVATSNSALIPSSAITFSGTAPNCVGSFTPSANLSGNANLTVRVTDGHSITSSNTFAVTVNPVDDAPIVSAINAVSTNEDVAKTVNFTITDIDSTLSCTGSTSILSSNNSLVNPSNVTFSGTAPNCSMTITPSAFQNGQTQLTLNVTDGTLTTQRTFNFTVASVDNAPSISFISNATTNEDISSTISFTVNDVDSTIVCNSSHLSATSSNPAVLLSTDIVFGGTYPNCTATLSPLANKYGSSNITITVTDGALSATSNAFSLTVNAVNDAPVISTILTPQLTNQDTAKVVNFTITDVDNTLTCAGSVTNVSSDPAIITSTNIVVTGTAPNCTATLTPLPGKSGALDITLTVSDGALTNSSSFSLVIVPVNAAPTISTLSNFSTNEDTAGSASFTINDVDSTLACNSSHLSATSSNTAVVSTSNIAFSGTAPNCTATFTPTANANGATSIAISVTDGSLTTTSNTVVLTVNAINDAPTISTIANQNINQDNTNAASFTINDIDSTLTCSGSVTASSSNTSLVANASVVITGTYPNCTATTTPVAGQSGSTNITLTVSDGSLNATNTFALTVAAVNAAPTISMIANFSTNEDSSVALNFSVNDVDSLMACDASHLSISSSNPTLLLATDVVFSGTIPNCVATFNPEANANGATNLTISATDGSLITTSNAFTLTVIAVNDAPTISTIASKSINQDTASVATFTINDIDSTLTCAGSVSGSSSDTSIVTNSNIVITGTYPNCVATVTPVAGQSGSLTISLVVSDGSLTNTTSYSLAIAAVNAAPTISSISNTSTNEDNATTINFTINDVDSTLACDSSHLSATSNNSSLINPSNITFGGTAPSCSAVITPTADLHGVASMTFKVTDGSLTTASNTFTLTVNAVDDAPTISSITNKSTNQDVASSANFTINDIDSTLTCSGSVSGTSSNTTLLPNANIVISGTYPNCIATATPAAGLYGSVNITLVVSDGSLTATSSYALAIAAVNAAPTISMLSNFSTNEDTPGGINFSINDVDSPMACDLSHLSIASSNPTLILNTDVVFGGTAPNCTATFSPAANVSDTSNITISVTDGSLTTTSNAFTLTVLAVNDAPTISSISNQAINQDTSSAVNFTINDIDSTLTCAGSVTGTSSNTAIVANANIVITGSSPNCVATVTPITGKNGPVDIYLTVSDGSLSAVSTYNLAIAAVNAAPTISMLTNTSTNEDTALAVNFTINDVDSTLGCDASHLSISSSTPTVVLNTDAVFSGTAPNCTATISPVANAYGSTNITISVTDGALTTTSNAFTLTVNAVNDAPVISTIAGQAINQDNSSVVNFTISDVDSTLTCAGSVTGSASNTSIVSNANIVITGSAPNCTATVTPTTGKNGTLNISLVVSDGSLNATSTYSLAIAAVNAAPTISTIANQVTNEDTALAINFTIHDVDSTLACNSSYLSASSGDSTLIDPGSSVIFSGTYPNCTATITPASNKSGSTSMSIVVSDGSLSATAGPFTVTVNAVNDAPVISSIGTQNLALNQTGTVNFTISDVDSSLSCTSSVSATSSNASVLPVSGITFSGTAPNCSATLVPVHNQGGAANVSFTVTDGALSASSSFAVTFDLNYVAPTANDLTPASFNEDTEQIVTLSYSNVQGDLASSCFISSTTNANVTTACSCNVAGVCTVGVTGVANFNGSAAFNYNVTANNSASNDATVTLTINPVNDAPVISSIAAQSTSEDVAKSVSFTISDVDSTLTCAGSVTASSSNTALIASGNITISGTAPTCTATMTPIADQNGSANITFTVSDGSLSAQSSFALTVSAVNDAPTMNAISAQSTNEDTALTVNFTINDIDSTLSCYGNVTANSNNATLVKTTNIIFGGNYPNCTATITPEADMNGLVNLSFTVNDGSLSATQSFNLTINAVNDAPTISTIAAQSTLEDTSKSVGFTINDIDSTLDCSTSVTASSSNTALLDAAHISISGTAPNCIATLSPLADKNGSANLTFTVSDGSLTAQSVFTLTVTPVNDAPTMGAITAQTTNEDTSKIVNFTINDIDSTLTCSGNVTAATSDTSIITVSDIVFGGTYPNCTATISPGANANGPVNLSFTVSDGSLTATQSFSFTVNAVNDAPTINTIAAQSTNEDTSKAINFIINDIDSTLDCSTSVTASSTNTSLVDLANITFSGSAPNCVATILPIADQNGSTNITFTVSDGSLNAQSTFALTVIAVDDAPTISAIASQTTLEDTSKSVSFTINDIDSTLTCSGSVMASSANTTLVGTANMTISGNAPNCMVTILPKADQNGSSNITLTVSDGTLSSQSTFALTVTPVNDAPTINTIAAQSTLEDVAKTVNFTINDIDSTLTCASSVTVASANTALIDPSNVTISGTAPNCVASIVPLQYQNGSADLTFTVSDGSLSAQSIFTLTVTPVNNAPTISAISSQSTLEDTSKTINFTINDVDSTLTCAGSVSASSSNNTLVGSANITISGTAPNCNAVVLPKADQNGSANITFTVNDGSLSAQSTFALTVTPVNDAPTIAYIAAQSTNEDTSKTVSFTINDIDSTLTCAGSVTASSSNTALADTANITISGTAPNCIATILPIADQNGATNITLTVSDGSLNAQSTFTLTVVAVDDAPTISALSAQTTLEDVSKAVNFTINDIDSPLTCAGSVTASSSNTNLVDTANITITGNAPNCTATILSKADQNGSANITLTVSDGTLSVSSTFALTVTPVNDAPTISTISAQSTNEDTSKAINFTINDIDSTLSCTSSITASSSNTALVGAANVTFSGTAPNCTATILPIADQNGSANITFTVSDGSLTSQSTFALTVVAVNDAPTMGAISAQTTNEDTVKVVNFTINDIDSTIACSNSVSVSSNNTVLVGATDVVFAGTYPNCTATITPKADANGLVNLSFTVSDGALSATQSFNLTVNPVNDAPTMGAIAAQTTNEDTTKAVSFTINDIDSTLTCAGSVTATSSNTALVGTSNIAISGTAPNCTATIVPLADQNGSTTITLTVSDGSLSTQGSFVLTVAAVNDAPTISFITNDSTDEDTVKNINFTISDVDSTLACDSSHLSVTSSNASVVLSTDITFSGTVPNCIARINPLPNQNGTTNINISVTDGSLTTTSNTFILTVNPVNDAPTIATIAAQSTDEDTTKTINFTINDIDSTLTCSGSMSATSSNTTIVSNANITFSGTYPNCVATVIPSADQNGTLNLTFTVSDGSLTASSTFALTFNPVNDPPTISTITSQSTNEDTPFNVNFTINDVDSVLTCSGRVSASTTNSAILTSSNVVISGTYPNCVATITPVANANGNLSVTLTVTDGALNASSTFALNVIPVDDPPVATNISSSPMTEDIQSLITLPYTDVENDLATSCSVSNLSHVTITSACACSSGLCKVGVTGTQDYNGTAGFSFNVTANGATSNTATATFAIAAVNDAPTISAIATQTTLEDTQLVVNFTIADVDSTLTCSSTNVTAVSSNTTKLPSASIIIGGTFPNCTATFTPALNQNGGPFNVTLTVSDGSLSNSSVFALNITPVDDPPVANNITSLTISEDVQAIATLTYVDVDGDLATSCSVSSLSNVTVTTPCSCNGSGVCTVGITGTQDYNGLAGFNFTVTTNSVVSNTASASFSILPVNDAPTMAAISAQTTLEDTPIAVNFTIADVDSTLTCASSVSKASSNTTAIPLTGIVITGTAPNCTATITPAANQNGSVNITLTVSDTLLTAARTFALTIQPVIDIGGSLNMTGIATTTSARTLSFASLTVDEAVSKVETCISEDTNLDGAISSGEKCNTQTYIDITSQIGANGSSTPSSWSNYTIKTGVNGASFITALQPSCSTTHRYFTYIRLTNASSNTTEFATAAWTFWNPSCIASSIGGWLDASDSATVFANTGCTTAVTSGTANGLQCWKDKSSNALVLKTTQTTFPKYVASSFASGMPAVVFNGNQDIYQNTTSINPKNIIAAVKVTANNDTDMLIGVTGGEYGVRINGSGSWYSSTTSYSLYDFTYAAGLVYVNGTLGAAHNLAEHVLYESKGSSSGAWSSLGVGGTEPTFLNLFQNRINANVGEIIICTTDCSTSQTKLEGFLAHKWGLQGNLPVAHPYKTTPP